MSSPLSIGAACTITIGLWIAVRMIRDKANPPYPPGPKGLPILGNVLDIDMNEPHVTYTEWGKTYGLYFRSTSCLTWLHAYICEGDIVYSRILGQDFVIVNSESIARILADQRSSNYSDRPHSPIYRM